MYHIGGFNGALRGRHARDRNLAPISGPGLRLSFKMRFAFGICKFRDIGLGIWDFQRPTISCFHYFQTLSLFE